MKQVAQPPRSARKKNREQLNAKSVDSTREGGDDLKDASPTDSRADEKVIVNQQREEKIVNTPSSSALNGEEDF